MAALFASPGERVFGDETGVETVNRFLAGVDALEGEDLLVVTHGRAMSLCVERLTGNDGFQLWQRLTMPCVLELSEGRLFVR